MLLTAAIVGATWYTINYGVGYPGYTAGGIWGDPIVMALIYGIFLGDMEGAMILGAYIQAIYMGQLAAGGNLPADKGAAGTIVIPIALITGMDTNTAMALAVPLSLLFSMLSIVKYLIDGLFVEPAERHADRADTAGVFRCAFVYPVLCKALLTWPLIFISIYLGNDFVTAVLDAIPAWLSHGLEVTGGMLPALGFGLTIMVIGQAKYIPLFLIGYFMVQYGALSTMACAIFAICVCLFVTFFRMDVVEQVKGDSDDWDDDEEDEESESAENARILSNGDVNKFFMRWWFLCEVSHNYQRMQAIAVCASMAPALKKMYPGEENKEELATALHRELMYFNSEGIWGSSVLGVALAMEEEQAITRAMSHEEATASINGFKVGFMGPFAGVGDTIDWAIIQYMLIGIGLPWAMEGNPMGAIPFFLGFPLFTIVEGLFFTNLGYRLGRAALGNLFASGMIDRLIECASMIGMMMMGALGSTYVSLSLANEEAQATLDSIIPGLLPLLLIFLIYFLLSRVTQQMQWITLGILVVSIVLAAIGLL